jgi:hypothetical protein
MKDMKGMKDIKECGRGIVQVGLVWTRAGRASPSSDAWPEAQGPLRGPAMPGNTRAPFMVFIRFTSFI